MICSSVEIVLCETAAEKCKKIVCFIYRQIPNILCAYYVKTMRFSGNLLPPHCKIVGNHLASLSTRL